MAEPAPSRTQGTPVDIYGRTYHLRGEEDGAYLRQLAAVVDRRMRDAAEASGTADSMKVAILACLNLADDWMQARRGAGGAMDEHERQRLARMIGLLDEALAG